MTPEETDDFDVLVTMKTESLRNRCALRGMISSVGDDQLILLSELTDALYSVDIFIGALDHAIARGFPSARPDHRG